MSSILYSETVVHSRLRWQTTPEPVEFAIQNQITLEQTPPYVVVFVSNFALIENHDDYYGQN